MKHLFDKRSVQPAALQLETSNTERQRISILDSRGMESTHNGIFIRDDAMVIYSNIYYHSHIRVTGWNEVMNIYYNPYGLVTT